ncbi:RING finger protein 37-like [Mizuhopecten yessoensis]|uniref:RING finger protein 37 n=1 Tax=Mizuhopecten yessoensis TaxID=6573 RepID=A0A210R1Y9_MIZYE|nr:RING finger protein 37-like [Mizuhopecten yessoensis]XP_021375002.1 RING finger protein 37-like [Mizuhopecten yessoensis]OWF55058.1 RING finger protein 37 [Mizuhopecten yessoensis]
MLVDFCNGQFAANITCDKVSADYYEVTNLVSQDWAKRRRGFLAETFIKPPVIITIAFPCNIELFRIIIDPKVGRQISSGIEIFTCSKKVDHCWLNGVSEQSTSCDSGMKSASMMYQQVGKAVMQDPGMLCFSNAQYRPFGEWHPENTVPASSAFQNARDLRHHKLSSLSFVSHLSVRVSRTINGSAVGIQRLEIWGQPSRSSRVDITNRIKALYLSSVPSNVKNTDCVVTRKGENPVADQINVDVYHEKGIEVPNDFIDKITWDIMTVPMLLPCGENIDQSTLEKHNSNEASWGRPPSDPYTGIHFHGNIQAIPNTSLKTRIDGFVLTHSDTLGHLPRTLGKSSTYTSKLALASKLVSQSKTHDNVQESRKIPENNKRTASDITDNSEVSTRAKRLKKSVTHCDSKTSEMKFSSVKLMTNTQQEPPSSTMTKLGDRSGETFTHGDSLKYSLDSALASTLGSLPSFTKFSRTSAKYQSSINSNLIDVSSSDKMCCMCKKDSSVMYRGACEHLMCRTCLTHSTGTLTCATCRAVWDRGEITRVHT